MDIGEIQHAIEALPPEQQLILLHWLAERDRREWDARIELDFSPGGAGHHGSIRARQRMLACIILSWLTTWQSSAWPASRSNA